MLSWTASWFSRTRPATHDRRLSQGATREPALVTKQTTRSDSALPRMTASGQAGTLPQTRDVLRRFHLTGQGTPATQGALRPAVTVALASPDTVWRDHPVFLPTDGDAVGLGRVVEQALTAMNQAGEATDLLGATVPRLVRAVARTLEGRLDAAPVATVWPAALDKFAGEFDLSPAALRELTKQIEGLRKRLPQNGTLVGLTSALLYHLTACAVRRDRLPRRTALAAEVQALAHRLAELLRVDDLNGPQASSESALTAAMGNGAGALDLGKLAGRIHTQRGSQRMDADRRQRVQLALGTLKRWLATMASTPLMVLLDAGVLPEGLTLDGVDIRRSAEAFHAAAQTFDDHAAAAADVLRAVRIARLEVAGEFDAAHHEEPLARLDWQSFDADALLCLPAIAVAETGDHLGGNESALLSRLLSGGRPILVLVADGPVGGEPNAASEVVVHAPGLGTLAIAHREALVLQATTSQPELLALGLSRLARATTPALAVVAVPGPGVDGAWLQLAAAREGRALPAFRHDPDAGPTWADRFDLTGNPQPERPWPLHPVAFVNANDEVATFDEAFTYAHAAALNPACRSQFLVLDDAVATDDLTPVADYLDALDHGPPRKMPFLWVVNADGHLARALVSRELAFAARDRVRMWRTLQELGGIHNEYARRAAEVARREAQREAEVEREVLRAEYERRIELARAEAGAEAMDRLVHVLLSAESLPVSTGVPTRPSSTPLAPRPAGTPANQIASAPAPVSVAADEEESGGFDEPYIDTPLCTSCNECTAANPVLFKYDGNKQATIGNAAGGTFLELVTSAEKCPARCIHPGKPRAGDASATPDVVARAVRFNR
jgi:hypothetical protein